MDWSILFAGLAVTLTLTVVTWLISLIKQDVSIVDSAWSLMIAAAGMIYVSEFSALHSIGIVLLVVWAIRLSAHITWRSWGEAEDHRYKTIRAKYSPNFAIKSLFIIFLFQAVLAWIISLPLYVFFQTPQDWNVLSVIALVMIVFGILYESIADWQLQQFHTLSTSSKSVLNSGLWRYSRHPNYFGEAIIWWGFALLASSHGNLWVFVSPVLLTYLLLKFSGVALLESTITQRRPEYQHYIETTNAFFPGPKRTTTANRLEEHNS